MNRLNVLIENNSELNPGDREYLEDIVKKYPWFRCAKFLLMRLYADIKEVQGYDKLSKSLGGTLIYYPTPKILLNKIENNKLRRLGKMNIINDFLKSNNFKIVANSNQSIVNEDIIKCGTEVSDSNIVSETLAEIYLKQGLKDEATKIYSKLSLKFPEKSVYFAKLIDEINK